ncbi:Bug family tripartite tricarboxylate transporter substrate binding protein [Variovorax sp. HJSM1_2]|uniref:Bug family tripartite tricarboxylate transporter substrate binding protein n=1 Tax=Variovorax sp. HJSM1_2 TaxID=3366263 RepID=UPI003BCA236B
MPSRTFANAALTRRRLIGNTLAAGIAAPWLLSPAQAQSAYPSKPLKLIVPYPPGGNTDVVARVFSTPLAEALGQAVVVDNRGGAAGAIGATAGARSAADGYNLVVGDLGTLCINRVARADLPYDPAKDFVPVSMIASVSVVITARNDLPVSNFKDFLALAKANPGKYKCGTSGPGSIGHLVLEMIKSMAGIDLVHVPYRGGAPAVTDLLGGHIDVMIDGAAFAQAKAGKIRPLATTGDRVAAMPDVPTLAESGIPGFHFTNFWGYLMPTGAPPAAVQRISKELQRIATTPSVRQQLEAAGLAAVGSTPQVFAEAIRSSDEKIAQIVKTANIQFTG